MAQVSKINMGGIDYDIRDRVLEQVVANIKPVIYQGTINNAPDEEDLTTENEHLKLKDRSNLNGMGYIILRKNKSFAAQVTQANTIYEIRYDYDLANDDVTIPYNCVLLFKGGSLTNGSVKADNTYIDAAPVKVFDRITITGTLLNPVAFVEWYGAIGNDENDDTNAFLAAFANHARFQLIGNYNVNALVVNNKVLTGINSRTTSIKGGIIAEDSTIEGILFKNSEYGIILKSGNTISYNIFSSCERGITTRPENNCLFNTIRDNTFELCSQFGIYLEWIGGALYENTIVSTIVVEHNYFSKCGTDVQNLESAGTPDDGYAIYISDCLNIQVRYNVFEYCSGGGVWVVKSKRTTSYVKDIVVEDNTCEGNKICDARVDALSASMGGLVVHRFASSHPHGYVRNYVNVIWYNGRFDVFEKKNDAELLYCESNKIGDIDNQLVLNNTYDFQFLSQYMTEFASCPIVDGVLKVENVFGSAPVQGNIADPQLRFNCKRGDKVTINIDLAIIANTISNPNNYFLLPTMVMNEEGVNVQNISFVLVRASNKSDFLYSNTFVANSDGYVTFGSGYFVENAAITGNESMIFGIKSIEAQIVGENQYGYYPTSGTFDARPTNSVGTLPVGLRYFCTDKLTSEGGSKGIEIIHKGNNVWVDALGRTIS